MESPGPRDHPPWLVRSTQRTDPGQMPESTVTLNVSMGTA